jgi:hypothetical protein
MFLDGFEVLRRNHISHVWPLPRPVYQTHASLSAAQASSHHITTSPIPSLPDGLDKFHLTSLSTTPLSPLAALLNTAAEFAHTTSACVQLFPEQQPLVPQTWPDGHSQLLE